MLIGVLALQGDFEAHRTVLERLGAEVREVRVPADLLGLDGLIIPGGESTTITRLMNMYGLYEPLRAFAGSHPVWGTCAGAIVMAKDATDLDRDPLRLMDIEVVRNAFGRQVDSFEVDLPFDEIDGEPLHAIFIRAPLIRSVGEGVKAVATLADGEIVAARQGHLLATSFHPELTDDTRVHAYFLRMVEEDKRAAEGVK
jgi:5'-phosphate synthase pdxT subunit